MAQPKFKYPLLKTIHEQTWSYKQHGTELFTRGKDNTSYLLILKLDKSKYEYLKIQDIISLKTNELRFTSKHDEYRVSIKK